MERKWFAVHTRPQWEKRVAELLTKRGITNYCPMNTVIIPRQDRYKAVTKPLFNSYVFVNTTERQFGELRKIEGIISAVHWLGKPAEIRDRDIEAIKSFLQEHNNVRLEKAIVKVNYNIRVSKGLEEALDSSLNDVLNNDVKVFLPSLGYVLLTQVQYTEKEKVGIATESILRQESRTYI